MKKYILIICTLLFTIVGTNTAGEGDTYIGLNTGYLYRNSLNANIFLEKEIANRNAFELYLDLSNQWSKADDGKIYKDTFWKYNRSWGLGIAYKNALIKGKNSHFRIRVGGDAGTDTKQLVGSVEIGFEWNIIFKNRMQFSICQKNDFVFGGKDHFRNGLLIGIKIPL